MRAWAIATALLIAAGTATPHCIAWIHGGEIFLDSRPEVSADYDYFYWQVRAQHLERTGLPGARSAVLVGPRGDRTAELLNARRLEDLAGIPRGRSSPRGSCRSRA